MANILAAIFGFLVGAIAGWTVVWVFFGVFVSPTSKIVIGTIVGLVFGGLVGSITGDANKAGSVNHTLVIAGIFGIVGGIMGATKLALIKDILQYYGISIMGS